MRWLPLFVALLLCTACSKKDSGPESADPSSDSSATAADAIGDKEPTEPAKAIPTPSPVGLELIEQGAEPRQELRWTLEAGSKQPLRISTVAVVSGTVGGILAVGQPPQKVTWDLSVSTKAVDANGVATAELRIEEAKVVEPGIARPGAAIIVENEAKNLIATTSGYFIDQLGPLAAPRIDVPANGNIHTFNLADTLQRALETVLIRLPEEPLGVGAQWKITRELVRDGAAVTLVSTVEIKKLEGAVVTFAVEHEYKAAPQEFPVRYIADTVYQLISMAAESSAEVTWDLTKALPTEATASDDFNQVIRHGKGKTQKYVKTNATFGTK